MKKAIIIGLASVILTLSGCASTSRGRLALIDIDFRDKDQIEASQYETIYGNTNTVAIAREPSRGFGWDLLFDFLKVAKFRARLMSIEWVGK